MSSPDRPDRIMDLFRMTKGQKPEEVTPTSFNLPQTKLDPAHTRAQKIIDLVREITNENHIAKTPKVRGRRMGGVWRGA